ncbi:MAG: TRAP transporter TatT component family protein [Spirochaetaceae bacterium]|jgi:predicted anti-sigma-YlaC factor YlaD|nr:TRAP transporter TatT component family protein [Spirochaetaceae bacterium]
MGKRVFAALGGLILWGLLSGCSLNKMVMKAAADALTGVGNSTVFTGDTDPELVGDALPFAIKVYEALLEQQPGHQGLIVTTGSLFVMYANAFVQGPAEMLPPEALDQRLAALERAQNLYLRGAAILRGGLEGRYPGIGRAQAEGSLDAYAARLKSADVPLIYWYVAASLSAYAIDPFDLNLGTRLPELSALINRAYELDPDFNEGALDEFFILFHGNVPPALGGDRSKIEEHYRLALEKSRGLSAGAYIAYAEAVAVPAQDYEAYKTCLGAALAIDVNQNPGTRLVNIIAQNRARYLLSHASWYFLEAEENEEGDYYW